MKIEILKPCYVDGKAKKVGAIVDTAKANLLIGMGKAKKAEETKAKKAPMNKKVDDFETR